MLPISLNILTFDSTLMTASSDLKEFIHQYTNDKEIFNFHDSMVLSTNKNFLYHTHFSVH